MYLFLFYVKSVQLFLNMIALYGRRRGGSPWRPNP